MNSIKSICELRPQILQIVKVTNVAISKQKRLADIQSVNRLLKLELTDGEKKMTAVGTEVINNLDESTPSGTKILLKFPKVLIVNKIFLLNNINAEIKVGNVPILVDKWLVEKSLVANERSHISTDNSPSPWIPFGQTIPQYVKSFKTLQTKDTKEDKDFKEKRHTTLKDIQSEKKTFSRNVKSVNDHVQDVIVAGFTFAQAKGALHKTKGNVHNAIELLRNQQKNRSSRYRKDDDHYEGSSSARPLVLSLGDFLQVGKDKTRISHKTKQSHNPQTSSRGARARIPYNKGLTSGRVKESDQLANVFQSWPHLQDNTEQWPGLDEAIEGSKAAALANPAPSNTQNAGYSQMNRESQSDYLPPFSNPRRGYHCGGRRGSSSRSSSYYRGRR
ncbi:tudor domain-containing protein 3-like [Artemia franciscana]